MTAGKLPGDRYSCICFFADNAIGSLLKSKAAIYERPTAVMQRVNCKYPKFPGMNRPVNGDGDMNVVRS